MLTGRRFERSQANRVREPRCQTASRAKRPIGACRKLHRRFGSRPPGPDSRRFGIPVRISGCLPGGDQNAMAASLPPAASQSGSGQCRGGVGDGSRRVAGDSARGCCSRGYGSSWAGSPTVAGRFGLSGIRSARGRGIAAHRRQEVGTDNGARRPRLGKTTEAAATATFGRRPSTGMDSDQLAEHAPQMSRKWPIPDSQAVDNFKNVTFGRGLHHRSLDICKLSFCITSRNFTSFLFAGKVQ
jgi:hypothetical protein